MGKIYIYFFNLYIQKFRGRKIGGYLRFRCHFVHLVQLKYTSSLRSMYQYRNFGDELDAGSVASISDPNTEFSRAEFDTSPITNKILSRLDGSQLIHKNFDSFPIPNDRYSSVLHDHSRNDQGIYVSNLHQSYKKHDAVGLSDPKVVDNVAIYLDGHPQYRHSFQNSQCSPHLSISGKSGNPIVKDSTFSDAKNLAMHYALTQEPSPGPSTTSFDNHLPIEPCRRDDAMASEPGPTPSEIILAQIHALRHSPTSPYKKRDGGGKQRIHLASPTPLEMVLYAADYASAARAPQPASPLPLPAQVLSRAPRRIGSQRKGLAPGRQRASASTSAPRLLPLLVFIAP